MITIIILTISGLVNSITSKTMVPTISNIHKITFTIFVIYLNIEATFIY